MLATYEWPFVVALALAALLVLGTTAGLGGDHEIDANGNGIPDDLEGLGALLVTLGFGRAPFGVSLVLLLGLFGVSGLITAPWVGALGSPLVGPTSTALALGAAIVGHRLLAGLVGRWLPSVETYASRADDRIGRVGVVVLRLGEGDVIVRVRLDDGTELRVRASSEAPHPSLGAQVVVVDHDETTRRDRVVLLPPEARRLPATNDKENDR